MNEFVTSLAEPNYLTSLALTAAPFSPADDTKFFFKSEQIEQRLNLLQHLIRASDKVALLFSEKGFGKSALLMQLQHVMGEDVRICLLDADLFIDPKALTLHCLQALGVDENEIRLSSDHLELLKQRCLSLQNLNIKPLLLIDNADQLSEVGLSTILGWLSWQENDQFLLQAVFTAKNAMPELNTIHGRIQRVDLPIFTEIELRAYLAHRLAAAGYQGELPFKDKVLKQIFKKSAGNPELINQLAHQELLGIKPVVGSNIFNRATLFKWLGVGLLVVSFTLLLVFQDKINTLFMPTEEKIKFDQLSEVTPESSVAMVIADSELNASEAKLVEVPIPEESTIIEEEKADLSAEEQGREELETLIAELPIAETEVDANLVEDEKIVKVDARSMDNQVLTSIEDKEITEDVNSQEWIVQQDSNYYTFQMMGSWDEEKVIDFIEKYELMDDVAIFKSKRSGRIWYALIYGAYKNKEVALQASNTWPETLKTLPKWLRRFDSVQQQIQK
ncbi:MAG: AAA family ATPase [Methylophagaceae bacterium]